MNKSQVDRADAAVDRAEHARPTLPPAIFSPKLAAASSLRPEVVSGRDIVIGRELTVDIYFGQPRGTHVREDGERVGVNTMIYSESEIRRICRVAFDIARQRGKRLCSVDKANVLASSRLWRRVAAEVVTGEFPALIFEHLLVDAVAMHLIRRPASFDVIVTENLFGDILTDEASMISGSLGMLPSASIGDSLNQAGYPRGLYEPIHGSAPDIAGKGIANPLGCLLYTSPSPRDRTRSRMPSSA